MRPSAPAATHTGNTINATASTPVSLVDPIPRDLAPMSLKKRETLPQVREATDAAIVAAEKEAITSAQSRGTIDVVTETDISDSTNLNARDSGLFNQEADLKPEDFFNPNEPRPPVEPSA